VCWGCACPFVSPRQVQGDRAALPAAWRPGLVSPAQGSFGGCASPRRLVGIAGAEPAASCPQSRRSSVELHPVGPARTKPAAISGSFPWRLTRGVVRAERGEGRIRTDDLPVAGRLLYRTELHPHDVKYRRPWLCSQVACPLRAKREAGPSGPAGGRHDACPSSRIYRAPGVYGSALAYFGVTPAVELCPLWGHPVWGRDLCLVEPAGFEPATFCMPCRRATGLRQGPIGARPRPTLLGAGRARSLGPGGRGPDLPGGVNAGRSRPEGTTSEHRDSSWRAARYSQVLADPTRVWSLPIPGSSWIIFQRAEISRQVGTLPHSCSAVELTSDEPVAALGLSPSAGGYRSLRTSRDGGTRTPNTRLWRPLLYQLSYTPMRCSVVPRKREEPPAVFRWRLLGGPVSRYPGSPLLPHGLESSGCMAVRACPDCQPSGW
jgi:hypothetical protein